MKFGVNTFIWSATFDSKDFPLLEAIREGFEGAELHIRGSGGPV